MPCRAVVYPDYISFFQLVWCVRWSNECIHCFPQVLRNYLKAPTGFILLLFFFYFLNLSVQCLSQCLYYSATVAAGNPLQLHWKECPMCPYKGKLTCVLDTSEFKALIRCCTLTSACSGNYYCSPSLIL